MKNLVDLAAEIINSSKAENWPAKNPQWAASVAEFNQRFARSKVSEAATVKPEPLKIHEPKPVAVSPTRVAFNTSDIEGD